ncbi:hypothetical protein FEM48_Zijuj01G0222400 [Ziziphus jujuba var. spinosa]|uniref:Uncharacterized protein n=1 Tax=Ziziphus jujuba var. spinosa TaxID=714518 RepID=A0A978W3V3_ZIZJJ|nr:hypothetical protein FEM48_Zijuj01G0222400 [Ziziphus jujuba var. spinosa]
MEAVGEVSGLIVIEVAMASCECCCLKMKNTRNFNFNLDRLEKEMQILRDQRKDVLHKLESAEKDGNPPSKKAQKWLRDVEELEHNVKSTQANITMMQNNTKRCRFKFSGKVARLLEQVDKLQKQYKFSSTYMNNCEGLNKMLEELAMNNLQGIVGPKLLTITSCNISDSNGKEYALSRPVACYHIYWKFFSDLTCFKSISELAGQLG